MKQLWAVVCAVIIPIMLSSAVFAQVHTPSYTLEDDPSPNQYRKIINIDSEYAWLVPAPGTPPPVELMSGWIINQDMTLVAGAVGVPIKFRLAPGSYTLKMWGFHDDPMEPLRAIVTEQVDIVLTREDSIYKALTDLADALTQTDALQITPDDLDAAFSPPVTP